METRVLTINLRRYLVGQPRTKRARKAARYLKERIAHYTSMETENVKIDRDLNSMIIKYYSKHMKPVKASVKISDGIARVFEFGKENIETTDKKKPKKSKIPFIKSKAQKDNVKESNTKITKDTASKTKINEDPTKQTITKDTKPKLTEKVQQPKEEVENGGSKA